MELKEYQQRALDQVKRYMEALSVWREKSLKSSELDLGEIDFPAKAWESCEINWDNYISRKNGLGEHLPIFCLKIPTGGGKTLLAVKAIDLVNQIYLKRQTGLVLWIVPTTQIYRQTLQSLKDRSHPYRQYLDIASGGKTLILEKNSHFSRIDVEENLAVLMLMLPSANRRNKEALKVFKDNGFMEFFPPEDDIEGQIKVLDLVPNLDVFGDEEGFWGRQIKTSLGNTLRTLKPLIILDEGHKAYSENAQATLRTFNPSMIVELSATPPKESNILVDIPGMDLLREEMIKLDLHITNKASYDWKETLLASVNHLNVLQKKAEEYEANSGNYIRPICVIQAERTGKDQIAPNVIHSESVKEYLIKNIGIPEQEIAIKTSEKDELKDIDNISQDGLLGRDCPVRFIITKHALQEGWDCPFAYVLTILTNPTSQNALTQLVGRILRQPYAKKTGVKELDESYVFCFQQRASDLLFDVKSGFEKEGLGDLAGKVVTEGSFEGEGVSDRIIEVREKFKDIAKGVILPFFAIKRVDKWEKVNYDIDVASKVDWSKIDLTKIYSLVLSNTEDKDIEQIATIVEDREQLIRQIDVRKIRQKGFEINSVFMARNLIDIVPNPWVAHDFSQLVIEQLIKKYDKQKIATNFVFIIEELRKHLLDERDRLAKEVFLSLIEKDILRFFIVGNNFGYKLPTTNKIKSTSRPLLNREWQQPQLSLFDFVPEEDFNETEKSVALYLDEQDKLLFWYRNIAKSDYPIQGWKKQKVYADFIFSTTEDKKSVDKIYVLETKGKHLVGNEDSKYKESLFDLCNKLALTKNADELNLAMKNKEVSFHFVPEDEWKQRLNAILT